MTALLDGGALVRNGSVWAVAEIGSLRGLVKSDSLRGVHGSDSLTRGSDWQRVGSKSSRPGGRLAQSARLWVAEGRVTA